MQLASRLVMLALGCVFWGGAEAQDSSPRLVVKDFVVEGENPLSSDETRAVLQPFLGEHESIEGLEAAVAALNRQLAARGFPARRAILPVQPLRDGVVKLALVTFRIGAISVEGNQHYSTQNVLASIPGLRSGTIPDGSELSRQLALANEHPTKSIEVQFKQGSVPREMDAKVEVRDERPYNFFLILNNRGTDNTEDTRLTLGAQHSNLFDKDHVLSASYTTSPQDVSAVRQYGANYRVPLYHANAVISVYFVDSDVDSGQVAGAFDVTDAGRFYGARYRQNLRHLGAYRHSLTVGVDDKRFENDVSFGGILLGTDVRSRPLSVRYDGSFRFAEGTSRFYATYVKNLPGGSKNDPRDYRAQRFGASDRWDAIRFGGSFGYSLWQDWTMQGRLDAQLSDEPLISGEQFGAGGVGSVRGYDERLVSGDSGVTASLELWSPALAYDIRGLAFIDAGYVKNKQPLPGERESINLASVGLGARWAWRPHVSLAMDVAVALQEVGDVNRGNADAHFELVIRF